VADSSPAEAGIAIRRVDGEGDRVTLEVGVDVGATSAQEGADPIAGARREHGQPARARAAEQSEEERLGAIVGVVGRREERALRGIRRRPKRCVARGAGSSLEIPPERDRDECPREGDVARPRERFGEIELRGGGLTQTVVDAMRDDGEIAVGAEPSEHVDERHRIGAAADRDEDARALRYEPRVAQQSAGEGDEGRGVRSSHAIEVSRAKRAAERGDGLLSDGGRGARRDLRELERFAELERLGVQITAARRGRVAERTTLGLRVELRAVFAREAELKLRRFVSQARVGDGLHFAPRLPRSRATTISTWLVCGNISNVSIARGTYPAAASGARSRPRVGASHET